MNTFRHYSTLRAVGVAVSLSVSWSWVATADPPWQPPPPFAEAVRSQLRAASSSSVRIRRPFENLTAQLGSGYDSKTGDFKLPCVKVKEGQPRSLGEFSQQKFESVESYEDVVNKLGLDVTSSMRYFSVQADANASVARDVRVSRYSSTGLLHLYVEKSASDVASVTPNDKEIVRLARNRNRFRERCGDSFVYSVILGGELTAAVTAAGSTRSEQAAVKAQFQAGFSAFLASGKIDAFFTKLDEGTTRSATSSLKLFAAGGLAEYVTKDELQSRAGKFFENARKNPVIVAMQTIGYEQVGGLSDAAYEVSPTTIGRCGMDLEQYVNDLLFMKSEPRAFGGVQEASVSAELDRTKALLAYVQRKIRENTPNWSRVCPTLPALPERTEFAPVTVARCGWNPVTFLQSNTAGWSMTRLGAWCPGSDPAWITECNANGYKGAGDADKFRCAEGDLPLKVRESAVQGPCHVESFILDGVCDDNMNQKGHEMSVEFTANLPTVDIERYKAALDAPK
jgi:hypothetical protein